jgi:hypothetical protein
MDSGFRFFDNREKYLLFVTTCTEKQVLPTRIGMEISSIRPKPPAFRLFDAGMGDATVLTRVMRELHDHLPTVPLFVVAKEISMEDVRIGLEKIADRFSEHPQTVLVLTNMKYSEAPWLSPHREEDQTSLNWWEVPLEGTSAHDFDMQIRSLESELARKWRTHPSPVSGNPIYVEPSVLILYRADQRFMLDSIIPAGPIEAGYDLVIASQPYRARMPALKKVRYVLGPLANSLAPGGRMIVIQSTGNDPGMELIRRIWPEESPFMTPRRDLITAMRQELGEEPSELSFHMYSDQRSMFKYHLRAMPSELGENIGTSTLLAGWNAAVYVAQIEDERLAKVLNNGSYIEPTREILQHYNGLWFQDESFVVERKV